MAVPLIDTIHSLNRYIDSYCKFSGTIQGIQTQQMHNINVDGKIYLKKYVDYPQYAFIQNISSNSFLPIFPQIKCRGTKIQKNQKYYFIVDKTNQEIRTIGKENYNRYDNFSEIVKRKQLPQNPALSGLRQDPDELVKVEVKKKVADLPICDFSNSKVNEQNKLEYEQIQHHINIYFFGTSLITLLILVFLIKNSKARNLFFAILITGIGVFFLIVYVITIMIAHFGSNVTDLIINF